MTNFFRKIPQSLVVLVLVLAVLTGHAFASEGDTSVSAPVDSAPVSSSDTPDTPDNSLNIRDNPPDDADGSDWDDDSGSFYYPSYDSYDTFTVPGADVTVNVEKHDTLSVTSLAPDTPEVLDRFVYLHAEPETPTVSTST